MWNSPWKTVYGVVYITLCRTRIFCIVLLKVRKNSLFRVSVVVWWRPGDVSAVGVSGRLRDICWFD